MAVEEDDDEGTEEETPIIGGSIERPSMRGHRVLEMDVIGWAIFVALLIVVIPLLPILAVIIVLLRILGYNSRKAVSWS